MRERIKTPANRASPSWRAAAVDRRERARREEITVEVRRDDAAEALGLGFCQVDTGREPRVVVEHIDVIHSNHSQEFADGRARPRQRGALIGLRKCPRVGAARQSLKLRPWQCTATRGRERSRRLAWCRSHSGSTLSNA